MPAQYASRLQRSPSTPKSPRTVAAIPTSPPVSPRSFASALAPPPPKHYLRGQAKQSDLFIKRSEIYTRVQRVLPASTDRDPDCLLLSKELQDELWVVQDRTRPASLPYDSDLVSHPDSTPLASDFPSSASSKSHRRAHSHGISSNVSSIDYEVDEVDEQPESSSSSSTSPSPPSTVSKGRQGRTPLRVFLRKRLTLAVRSRSVETATAATAPVTPTRHSSDLPSPAYQHNPWSPSPYSSSSSLGSENPEYDADKRVTCVHHQPLPSAPPTAPLFTVSGARPLPSAPPTAPLFTVSGARPLPSAPPTAPLFTVSGARPLPLADAQKRRRALAADHFTRYSENMPFHRQDVLASASESQRVAYNPVTGSHWTTSAPNLHGSLDIANATTTPSAAVPPLPIQPQKSHRLRGSGGIRALWAASK